MLRPFPVLLLISVFCTHIHKFCTAESDGVPGDNFQVAIFGGQKFDAWVRFTECYPKTQGRWLAIHDHISVPVDLDTGKAVLDAKP